MPRKLTAEDLFALQIVSDPQFSPDGTQIAFVRKWIDAEKSKYRREIWVVSAQGGAPRQFTCGEGSDTSPRWSPDGTQLAFLSDRKKPENQIFVLPANGGEARALTKLSTEGSLSAIRWSPDGTRIAFLFRETPEAYRKAAVEERQKKELPPPPRVHTRLQYRLDGFGYWEETYPQLWVAEVATGECRPLTEGPFACESPVWSPDGATLAFLSDRREQGDLGPWHQDIWTVPSEGGALTRIASPPGGKRGLTWSPDGKRFAYAGSPDPQDWWQTRNERLFVLPATGGDTALDLTGHTDQTVGYWTLSDSHEISEEDLIQWTADSSALFFPISASGDTRLCFTSAESPGTVIPVSPENAEMSGFSISADGRAAVTLSTQTTVQELFALIAPDAEHLTMQCLPRTEFNRALLEEVTIYAPETLHIANDEGGTVHGWLLRPPDFDPSQTYPLVLYVHGGPHTQYGNTFFHELHWLAAEGFCVLYTNPRGSRGYGEDYTRAIIGDWGSVDFDDLMTATDYAAALPFIDANRMAIMGGSYGGFMSAWAVGHTDRFACAITDRPVINMQSMAGTCDFPWPPDAYFKGNAWSDPAELWRCSPLAYAAQIHTPLLIVHSDGDYRCPHGQAEELFAALRLQRKVVEYVRYPTETSHGLSRTGPPSLRLDRLNRNLNWLHRWLK
jgi:acylaminoacyl-peptidase